MELYNLVTSILVLLCGLTHQARGTGSLYDPPSRPVMWKYGYPTQKNYNYMQLNCGGEKQLEEGPKQCGVCGDYINGTRYHEYGGTYGTGLIGRFYPAGIKEFQVKVELLAFEEGFFEFRLCPANDHPVTQACLDEHLLPIKEGYLAGTPFRFLPKAAGDYRLTIAVPPNLTCDRCVLQWRYHTANSWGADPVTGQEGKGYGPQEEFYNCADIRIGGVLPDSVRANPFFAPLDNSARVDVINTGTNRAAAGNAAKPTVVDHTNPNSFGMLIDTANPGNNLSINSATSVNDKTVNTEWRRMIQGMGSSFGRKTSQKVGIIDETNMIPPLDSIPALSETAGETIGQSSVPTGTTGNVDSLSMLANNGQQGTLTIQTGTSEIQDAINTFNANLATSDILTNTESDPTFNQKQMASLVLDTTGGQSASIADQTAAMGQSEQLGAIDLTNRLDIGMTAGDGAANVGAFDGKTAQKRKSAEQLIERQPFASRSDQTFISSSSVGGSEGQEPAFVSSSNIGGTSDQAEFLSIPDVGGATVQEQAFVSVSNEGGATGQDQVFVSTSNVGGASGQDQAFVSTSNVGGATRQDQAFLTIPDVGGTTGQDQAFVSVSNVGGATGQDQAFLTIPDVGGTTRQDQAFVSTSNVGGTTGQDQAFLTIPDVGGTTGQDQAFVSVSNVGGATRQDQAFVSVSNVGGATGQDQAFVSTSNVGGATRQDQAFLTIPDVGGATGQDQAFVSTSNVGGATRQDQAFLTIPDVSGATGQDQAFLAIPDVGGASGQDQAFLTIPDVSGATGQEQAFLTIPDVGGATGQDQAFLSVPDVGGATGHDQSFVSSSNAGLATGQDQAFASVSNVGGASGQDRAFLTLPDVGGASGQDQAFVSVSNGGGASGQDQAFVSSSNVDGASGQDRAFLTLPDVGGASGQDQAFVSVSNGGGASGQDQAFVSVSNGRGVTGQDQAFVSSSNVDGASGQDRAFLTLPDVGGATGQDQAFVSVSNVGGATVQDQAFLSVSNVDGTTGQDQAFVSSSNVGGESGQDQAFLTLPDVGGATGQDQAFVSTSNVGGATRQDQAFLTLPDVGGATGQDQAFVSTSNVGGSSGQDQAFLTLPDVGGTTGQDQAFVSVSNVGGATVQDQAFLSVPDVDGTTGQDQAFVSVSNVGGESGQDQAFVSVSNVGGASGQDQAFASVSNVGGASGQDQAFASVSDVGGATGQDQAFISSSNVGGATVQDQTFVSSSNVDGASKQNQAFIPVPDIGGARGQDQAFISSSNVGLATGQDQAFVSSSNVGGATGNDQAFLTIPDVGGATGQDQAFVSTSNVGGATRQDQAFLTIPDVGGATGQDQVFVSSSDVGGATRQDQAFLTIPDVGGAIGQDQAFVSSSDVGGATGQDQVFVSSSDVGGATGQDQVFVSSSNLGGATGLDQAFVSSSDVGQEQGFLTTSDIGATGQDTVMLSSNLGGASGQDQAFISVPDVGGTAGKDQTFLSSVSGSASGFDQPFISTSSAGVVRGMDHPPGGEVAAESVQATIVSSDGGTTGLDQAFVSSSNAPTRPDGTFISSTGVEAETGQVSFTTSNNLSVERQGVTKGLPNSIPYELNEQNSFQPSDIASIKLSVDNILNSAAGNQANTVPDVIPPVNENMQVGSVNNEQQQDILFDTAHEGKQVTLLTSLDQQNRPVELTNSQEITKAQLQANQNVNIENTLITNTGVQSDQGFIEPLPTDMGRTIDVMNQQGTVQMGALETRRNTNTNLNLGSIDVRSSVPSISDSLVETVPLEGGLGQNIGGMNTNVPDMQASSIGVGHQSSSLPAVTQLDQNIGGLNMQLSESIATNDVGNKASPVSIGTELDPNIGGINMQLSKSIPTNDVGNKASPVSIGTEYDPNIGGINMQLSESIPTNDVGNKASLVSIGTELDPSIGGIDIQISKSIPTNDIGNKVSTFPSDFQQTPIQVGGDIPIPAIDVRPDVGVRDQSVTGMGASDIKPISMDPFNLSNTPKTEVHSTPIIDQLGQDMSLTNGQTQAVVSSVNDRNSINVDFIPPIDEQLQVIATSNKDQFVDSATPLKSSNVDIDLASIGMQSIGMKGDVTNSLGNREITSIDLLKTPIDASITMTRDTRPVSAVTVMDGTTQVSGGSPGLAVDILNTQGSSGNTLINLKPQTGASSSVIETSMTKDTQPAGEATVIDVRQQTGGTSLQNINPPQTGPIITTIDATRMREQNTGFTGDVSNSQRTMDSTLINLNPQPKSNIPIDITFRKATTPVGGITVIDVQQGTSGIKTDINPQTGATITSIDTSMVTGMRSGGPATTMDGSPQLSRQNVNPKPRTNINSQVIVSNTVVSDEPIVNNVDTTPDVTTFMNDVRATKERMNRKFQAKSMVQNNRNSAEGRPIDIKNEINNFNMNTIPDDNVMVTNVQVDSAGVLRPRFGQRVDQTTRFRNLNRSFNTTNAGSSPTGDMETRGSGPAISSDRAVRVVIDPRTGAESRIWDSITDGSVRRIDLRTPSGARRPGDNRDMGPGRSGRDRLTRRTGFTSSRSDERARTRSRMASRRDSQRPRSLPPARSREVSRRTRFEPSGPRRLLPDGRQRGRGEFRGDRIPIPTRPRDARFGTDRRFREGGGIDRARFRPIVRDGFFPPPPRGPTGGATRFEGLSPFRGTGGLGFPGLTFGGGRGGFGSSGFPVFEGGVFPGASPILASSLGTGPFDPFMGGSLTPTGFTGF